MLGHGPAASGCFSGTPAACAALEPALLPAKLLPFLQIFPFFFWKAAELCHLHRPERCWGSCPERNNWDGERGRKSLPQPCRTSPPTSTQPPSPALCAPGAWDVFLRDQSFLVHPRCSGLGGSHGDSGGVTAQRERSLLLQGQNWKEKSRESFHGTAAAGRDWGRKHPWGLSITTSSRGLRGDEGVKGILQGSRQAQGPPGPPQMGFPGSSRGLWRPSPADQCSCYFQAVKQQWGKQRTLFKHHKRQRGRQLSPALTLLACCN